jgi:drug/metabolite transporter (DMT)-like permease
VTGLRDRVALAAFGATALLAGGNGVAIRFSNRELAPLWGAALRFILAAMLLLALMALMKLALPRGQALAGAVLYGVFQFSGAFGLYYYALVEVHAGLGQTLLALVPLATLLLAVVQRQEQLTRLSVVGSLLGLVGVIFVASDPLRGSVPVVSLLAVLGSVLCFAQAAVVVRRFPSLHPVALNGVGMMAGAAILVGASALAGEPFAVPERVATWAALAYVVAAGSIGVFMLYVFLLQRWTASRASYVMLVIPVVTVLLSAWLDDEPVGPGLVIGGLLVLASVYIGALRPARTSARATEAAGAA